MEATINLEQSAFKQLIDQANTLPGFDHPNGVQNLLTQILILAGGGGANFMANYSGDKLLNNKLGIDNVDQLLARPSIVKLIGKFIDGWLGDAGSSSSVAAASKKNVAKSVDFRNRGNREFGRRNSTQAAYLYTMAIVYAPNVAENDVDVHKDNIPKDNVPKDNVPEELSLAFGNRSAVFYELGLYRAALEDIDHALATGYPRSKLSKLLLRKIDCLISLNRLGAAKKAWDYLIVTIGTEPSDVRALKIRLQLMDIKSSHDDDAQKEDNQIPSTNSMLPVIEYLRRTGRYKPTDGLAPVSAKLEPRYSPTKGRHLVAKVDIEPGDIVMVESPYTTVLNKEYEYHFCHHCCRRLESDLVVNKSDGDSQGQLCINGALVPCTSCTRVLYCSTVCRTESWRLYHQYECGLQPILCQLASHMNSVFALRILFTTGLDVAQQVITRNKHEEESKLPVLGNDPDTESQYEQVYRLVHHRDKESPLELCCFVNMTALLVQLTRKCGFVHTDKQAKLAGTILLRHLLQLSVTTHGISTSKRTQMCSYYPFDFARGLYPVTSALMNHSCDLNTIPTWCHGALMVQRATRRIPAGTEVTTSYGPTFTEKDRAERQKFLWDSYHFRCDCSKCLLEARDGIEGRYYPIGCQKCGCPLSRESSSSATFRCSSSACKSGVKMSLLDMKRAYTRIESQLATVLQLVQSYEQIVLAGRLCTLAQLTEWERQLSELSKGVPQYYNLALLYNQLADHCEHSPYPGTARMARQCFERFCQIKELLNGISPALYLHTVKLGLLYGCEEISPDFQASSSRGHRILSQRVLKRSIELLRQFSLADVQHNSGPDLLVDDARYLWDKHRQLAECL